MSNLTSFEEKLEYLMLFYDSRFRIDPYSFQAAVPPDFYAEACRSLMHDSNEHILGYVINGDHTLIAHNLNFTGGKRSVIDIFEFDINDPHWNKCTIFHGGGTDEELVRFFDSMKEVYQLKKEMGIPYLEEYVPENANQ